MMSTSTPVSLRSLNCSTGLPSKLPNSSTATLIAVISSFVRRVDIRNRQEAEAGEGEEMDEVKRRATVHDVAREAGVSLATVDRVLNGRPGVRTETADKVAEAIKAL